MIAIPITLAFAAWHTTERRVGTRDEWVALLGSLTGWVTYLAMGAL